MKLSKEIIRIFNLKKGTLRIFHISKNIRTYIFTLLIKKGCVVNCAIRAGFQCALKLFLSWLINSRNFINYAETIKLFINQLSKSFRQTFKIWHIYQSLPPSPQHERALVMIRWIVLYVKSDFYLCITIIHIYW